MWPAKGEEVVGIGANLDVANDASRRRARIGVEKSELLKLTRGVSWRKGKERLPEIKGRKK